MFGVVLVMVIELISDSEFCVGGVWYFGYFDESVDK